MQKSLIYLSQSIHTEAVQHFHVSIALFDSGVGCHSGVRGDNTLFP